MPDFPHTFVVPNKTFISSHGPAGLIGDSAITTTTTVTWPVANTAYFMPIFLEYPVLAQKIGVRIGVQSGNLDAGIYTKAGAKIVTAGTTPVGVAGLQVLDIADTWLMPGSYYLALAVDNITASLFCTARAIGIAVTAGCQEMATAFVLPTAATLVKPITAYQPLIVLQGGNATL